MGNQKPVVATNNFPKINMDFKEKKTVLCHTVIQLARKSTAQITTVILDRILTKGSKMEDLFQILLLSYIE